MQRMSGAGPMMQQQIRTPANNGHLQGIVYQNLMQNAQAFNGASWQASVNNNDRLGRIMNL